MVTSNFICEIVLPESWSKEDTLLRRIMMKAGLLGDGSGVRWRTE